MCTVPATSQCNRRVSHDTVNGSAVRSDRSLVFNATNDDWGFAVRPCLVCVCAPIVRQCEHSESKKHSCVERWYRVCYDKTQAVFMGVWAVA